MNIKQNRHRKPPHRVRDEISKPISSEHEFGVFAHGGSIGYEPSKTTLVKMTGKGRSLLIHTYPTKESANEYIKFKRKGLSQGEKKYYKMGFSLSRLSPKDREFLASVESANPAKVEDDLVERDVNGKKLKVKELSNSDEAKKFLDENSGYSAVDEENGKVYVTLDEN